MFPHSSHILEMQGAYAHQYWWKRKLEHESSMGITVLDLGKWSPDISPSDNYLENLKKNLTNSWSHLYPGYTCMPTFERALRVWYEERFQVRLPEWSIAVVSGAKDAITHLPYAFLDHWDSCLVPDPGYPAFRDSLMFRWATVETYANWTDLKNKLSNGCRAVWINSPANPTGEIIPKKELEEIVRLCVEHSVLLWFDTAYVDIVFDGVKNMSIFEIPGAEKIALEIGSFSKSHSFAGFRIWWVAGSPILIDIFLRMKSFFDSGVSQPLQNMVAEALNKPDINWHTSAIETYKKRRDNLYCQLQEFFPIVYKPSWWLYFWLQVPEGFTDISYTDFLLTNHNILVTPWTVFWKAWSQHVRASFSAYLI